MPITKPTAIEIIKYKRKYKKSSAQFNKIIIIIVQCACIAPKFTTFQYLVKIFI